MTEAELFARMRELEEALKPFAWVAKQLEEVRQKYNPADGTQLNILPSYYLTPTVGDCRRAAWLLEGQQ